MFKAYPQFTQVSVCFINTTSIKDWGVCRFEALRPAPTAAGPVASRDSIDMDFMIVKERKAVGGLEDLEDGEIVQAE